MYIDVKRIMYDMIVATAYINNISNSHERMKRWGILTNDLAKFNPGIPDDGTTGFIAFNTGSQRMKIKTGRFLTKKLNLNSGFIPDEFLQKIAHSINKCLFGVELKIRLDKGVAIRENYANNVGGSSCMSGNCACYVGLYVDNQDRYQQLIVEFGNDSARAMVVKLDNGKFFLDRIYTTSENLIPEIKKYTKEQGWLYRAYNDADEYEVFKDGEHEIDNYNQMIVSGLNYNDGEVPFQDTLIDYDLANHKLNLFHGKSDYDAIGRVDATNGYLENGDEPRCCCCGDYISEENLYSANDEYYCECCFDENFSTCYQCGDPENNDNCVESNSCDVYCRHCADVYLFRCSDCGEYHVISDMIEANDRAYCESCFGEKFYYCKDCDELVEIDKECNCKETANV